MDSGEITEYRGGYDDYIKSGAAKPVNRRRKPSRMN